MFPYYKTYLCLPSIGFTAVVVVDSCDDDGVAAVAVTAVAAAVVSARVDDVDDT